MREDRTPAALYPSAFILDPLSFILAPMLCPPDPDLAGFLNDALADDARERVSAHVDGCPACQARLDHLTVDASGAVARYKDLSAVTSGFSGEWHANGPAAAKPVDRSGDTEVLHVPGRGVPRFVGLPTVPGFDVLAEIGRGGMGVVYKARHKRLNRAVALKMILAGGAAGPKAVQRFFFEAEVLARVRHPQVVQVYEIDLYQGPGGVPVPYLAMELLEGGTLSARLKAGRLAPPEAAALLEGVARAVHAAHLQGVVHRDLKPGNILFGKDEGSRMRDQGGQPPPDSSFILHPSSFPPKVSDFGLAKFIRETGADLTHSGAVVGTPAYMAPEQAGGRGPVGPAADVYALGAILFEALTGRPPFEGREPMAVLLKVTGEEAPDVRRVRPDVPRDLATITARCLAKEPARRYPSAADLADDLLRFRENRPTKARPPRAPERAWLWVRRNPVVAGLLAGLAAMLAVGVASVFTLWLRAERTADAERRAKEATAAALEEGERQRALAVGREARLEFDRGVGLCEDGQVGQGVGHLLRALDLAEASGGADLARVTRVHLAAWPVRLSPRVRTFPLGRPARAVAFTPDGTRLVAAGADGTLDLWDVDAGRKVRTYRVPDAPPGFAVRSVAVGPGGKHVAAGGSDGKAWVWDADADAARFALPAAPAGEAVEAVAFAPDGSLWASGGAAARRWDAATRAPVAEISRKVLGTPVLALALSADGTRLFTGDRGGFVCEWDAASRNVVNVWAGVGAVTSLAVNAEGTALAATGPTGVGRVVNLTTHKTDHEIGLRGATGLAAAFAPGGDLVLLGDGDGNVRTTHRGTGQPVGVPLRFGGGLAAVRIRPGGDEFAVAAGDAVHLCRLAPPGWRPLGPTARDPIAALDIDPAGKRVAVAAGREVRVYDARTGTLERAYPTERETLTVRFDPTRPRLLRGTPDGWGALKLPGGPLSPSPAGEGRAFPFLAASADGGEVVTSDGSTLETWDAATFTRRSGGTAGRVLDARPGELLTASGGTLGFVGLPGFDRRRPPRTLADEVTAARFSPDGTRVLAGLRNNAAVWLDAATGEALVAPLPHGRAVTAVAVAQDGRTLLTASRDGTARFWDAATGLPLGPVLRHAGPVTAVAFSPSGDRAITGTSNGHTLIWDAPPPPLAGTPAEVRARLADVLRE